MSISDVDKKIINNILDTYTFPTTQIININGGTVSGDAILKFSNNPKAGIRTLLFVSFDDIAGVLKMPIVDDPKFEKKLTQTIAEAEEKTIEDLRARLDTINDYYFYNMSGKTITPSDAIINTKIIRDIKYRGKVLIVLLDHTTQTDTVEVFPENLQMHCPDNMKNAEQPKECPECSDSTECNNTTYLVIIIILIIMCLCASGTACFIYKKQK